MISAVIHTYNEEANIERVIRSLSFVDEIVVIDMGSVDRTVAIAKKVGAVIYTHSFTGFVEPARNFGISKATGDWILIVDADEEIPISLSHIIKAKTEKNEYSFYRIPRKNIIFGKWIRHAGWWPDYQIRLFRKSSVFWSEKIHGVPETHGKGMDLKAEEPNAILHHNYQSLEQYMNRMNRYTGIAAKELYLANVTGGPSELIKRPVREFINRYFAWEGYKDGMYGLVLSLLQTVSELITYIKLWELYEYKETPVIMGETEADIRKSYLEIQHWLIEVGLKKPHTEIERIGLKLKRKLGLYE